MADCWRITGEGSCCLTDKGVVQADLAKYIIRPANQLSWDDAEKFA